MRKIFLIFLLLFVMGNTAWATTFNEFYQGCQYITEIPKHDSYYFTFDIVNKNDDTTNSKLKLISDEAVGLDSSPLNSASAYIDLISYDWCAYEKAEIELAMSDGVTTIGLYSGKIYDTKKDGYMRRFAFDLLNYDNGSFLKNPAGEITISAIITGCKNFNDFFIKKVGIKGEVGAASVPEPSTLFLLGGGLIGLAVGTRRKR